MSLTVYETLERPLPSVLGRMERRGISIDRQVLSRLSSEFGQKQADSKTRSASSSAGRSTSAAPSRSATCCSARWACRAARRPRPGSGRPTPGAGGTGRPGPRAAADAARLAPALQAARTYTDALPGYVNAETDRVHTSYALASTTTGRLSSSDPNLQNIPVRTEEGRKIRRAFVAEPGTMLISADYTQIELRLLAQIGDIPALRKAFLDGLDIHAMTASEMFGVPVKDMPAEMRRRAKAINFGIIYGISAFGLANQLAIPRDEAGAYIKNYFERFPGIRDYMEETKAFAKKNGYVTTLFGRKCHYPDIAAGNPSLRAFDERAAINAPIQGSAADIIRRAMIRIAPALTRAQAQRQDAAAGARRTDLRGARGRGREDAAGRQAGDGGCADAGGVALGAAAGRRPRRAQLGRGALSLLRAGGRKPPPRSTTVTHARRGYGKRGLEGHAVSYRHHRHPDRSAAGGAAARGLARPQHAGGNQPPPPGRDLNSVVSSVRSYYGSNVVGRVLASPGQTQVVHNYESVPGAVPIPATLSLELGRVISEQQQNISYRFVSDYPFAERTPHVLDDFEKYAIATLRAQPNQQIAQRHPGRRSGTRCGWSRRCIMGQACVNCHNSHPQSPKHDWKVGDVRGIQEVTITQAIATNIFSFKYLLGLFRA